MKKKLIEMPLELFKEIEKEATKNARSVNGQIVFMLNKSIKK